MTGFVDAAIRDGVTMGLLAVGTLFVLIASIGILRMPDVYMRMSATSKAATFGAGLAVLAVLIDADTLGTAARAAATIIFLVSTAPIAAHMIGRAAYVAGVPLWSSTVRDDLDGCYDADSHTLGTPDRPPERGLRTVRDDAPRVGDGDDQPGAGSHKRRG